MLAVRLQMINLLKKILILIVFYSVSLSAQTAMTASELVGRDITPAILKLSNDTYFYNYFSINRNILGNGNPFLLEANRNIFSSSYVYSRSSQFWNMSNHTTARANAGLGLYLATDPFISSPQAEEYSGANFGDVMIELTFAKDTPYLTVKKDIPLKEDTIAALITEKILTLRQIHNLLEGNRISQDTLKYIAEPEYINFRKLMHNLMNQNSVSLIEYAWLSSLELFCNNKHLTSAMVYVSKTGVEANLLKTSLIYWPGNISKMALNIEENASYTRNLKLIRLLSKLKPLEENSRLTRAKTYIEAAYNNEQDLHEVKEKLFKCED
jgi:hypothetical protein